MQLNSDLYDEIGEFFLTQKMSLVKASCKILFRSLQDFFARVETTFFLFDFFGVGFFLDFLTAGRGGDGVGDGLVGVSDGVPGSGAGNEGGLIEIFKEGGDVMATFSSATDTLGGDFISNFQDFLVFLSCASGQGEQLSLVR